MDNLKEVNDYLDQEILVNSNRMLLFQEYRKIREQLYENIQQREIKLSRDHQALMYSDRIFFDITDTLSKYKTGSTDFFYNKSDNRFLLRADIVKGEYHYQIKWDWHMSPFEDDWSSTLIVEEIHTKDPSESRRIELRPHMVFFQSTGLEYILNRNCEERPDLFLIEPILPEVERKYQLTEETRTYEGRTLYRIQAIKWFENVKEGDLGGFVQSLANLSQTGNCWIYGDCMVCDQSQVLEDARLFGRVIVMNKSIICGHAILSGDTEVSGESIVKDTSIFGEVKISDSQLSGGARIGNRVKITGHSVIKGDVELMGDVELRESAKMIEPFILPMKLSEDQVIVGEMKFPPISITPIGFGNSISFAGTKDGSHYFKISDFRVVRSAENWRSVARNNLFWLSFDREIRRAVIRAFLLIEREIKYFEK